MYGDPGTGIADVIQARKAQKEQSFYNSLLSYAMQAGGEFEIINDMPVFVPGGDMPTKSEMWNQLLQAKGGRLSAADVQQFESAWQQSNQMKTSKQLQELNKLANKGYTPEEIKETIGDSPELYNNLLDLVGDLEATGDENDFQQAQIVKGMIPEMDRGGLIGENPFMATMGAASLGLGAAHLMGTDPSMMENVKKLRAERKDIRQDISKLKKQRANISVKDTPRMEEIKRQMNINKAKLSDEKRKHLLKRNDATIKNLRAEADQLQRDLKTAGKTPSAANQAKIDAINKRIGELNTQKAAMPTPEEYKKLQPTSRYEQLKGKYSKLGSFGKGGVQMGGYMGMGAMRSLGKYLGGETGESIGRTIGNLGMLGLSLRGTPWLAPILAAQPLSDLYAQYQGR